MRYSTQLLRQTRKAIGRNIRVLRENRRLTLRALSVQCGVAADLLDRYEMGRNEISFNDIVKIACALGCTPRALLPE